MKSTLTRFFAVLSLGLSSVSFASWEVEVLSLLDVDDIVSQHFHLGIDASVPRGIGCHLAMVQARNESWGSRQFFDLTSIRQALATTTINQEFLGMDGGSGFDKLAFALAYSYGAIGPGRDMDGYPSYAVKKDKRVVAIGIVSRPEKTGAVLHDILVRREALGDAEKVRAYFFEHYLQRSPGGQRPERLRAFTLADGSEATVQKSAALMGLGFRFMNFGFPAETKTAVSNWVFERNR